MRRRNNRKSFVGIILLIIVLMIGFIGFKSLKVEEDFTTLSSKIDEKISKIVELSTVEYNYTNILEYENSKQLSGLNIPFTHKTFLVQYKGKIKAGVDLDTINVDVVDRKTVNITMKEASVIDNIIDEEDVFFYNEKDTVFNKLKFKELYDILIEEKAKVEREAIEDGLLLDAKENSEELLKTILKEMGFDNIEINYN